MPPSWAAKRQINKPDFRVTPHWPVKGRRLHRRRPLAATAIFLVCTPRPKKGPKQALVPATKALDTPAGWGWQGDPKGCYGQS